MFHTAAKMDVFGTVGTAIDLAFKLAEYIRGVSEYPKQRKEIEAELSILQSLLIIFCNQRDTAAQSNLESWHSVLQQLGKPDGPLDQFERAMRELSNRIITNKHKHLKAMLWPLIKPEIKDLLIKIENLKTTVLSCFVTMNL